VIKRIPNILAYIETRTRDLTVPSIGKERVSTVAEPELIVAVKIYGILRLINSEFCTRKIAVKIPKIWLLMDMRSHTDAHVHCATLYSTLTKIIKKIDYMFPFKKRQ
jgi:hypothetical protein